MQSCWRRHGGGSGGGFPFPFSFVDRVVAVIDNARSPCPAPLTHRRRPPPYALPFVVGWVAVAVAETVAVVLAVALEVAVAAVFPFLFVR